MSLLSGISLLPRSKIVLLLLLQLAPIAILYCFYYFGIADVWLYTALICCQSASCIAIFMLLRKATHLANHQNLLLDTALSSIESSLKQTDRAGDSAANRLEVINAKLAQLHKRDVEVRHLVRVQGLIDHELAIGNRVFFESKLQHFLSENADYSNGGLYIIQLSHPENNVSRAVQLQRLKGCADMLHAVAADYNETVLARISDNDLVLLVAGISGKELEKLGDKIAGLLSRAACMADCIEQDVLHIGYAAYQSGLTSYQVLAEADMALRTAQLHGPNAAYGFQRTEEKSLARGSVWWRSELNRALQEQRFQLNFQPVISWQDGDVLQHEVLVRLQCSDGQKVPASLFLPMAYNCGLAAQLDQHIMIKAAKICAAEARHNSRCSINISVHALLDNQWWEWLESMQVSGQLDAAQFALEISEHHLLRHYKALRSKLQKLHHAGFALIIDQVGLVIDHAMYAEELPLESVKLHPSVVRNIDQHLEQQLFVRGLVAGYASKGIRVIACGVEQEQEWSVLQKLGIAGGQGYYFSEPLNRIIAQGQVS